MPGSHTSEHSKEAGDLSVGTLYLEKCLGAFMALKGYKTPIHLYNSLEPSLQLRDKHKKFLQNIREVISDRIINEEYRVHTLNISLVSLVEIMLGKPTLAAVQYALHLHVRN